MPRPKENFMDAEVVDFERGSHQIHPPDPQISWALGGYNIFPFPGHPTPRSRIDSSGFELAKRSSRRAERSCFGKLRLRRGNGPGLFCFLGVRAADGHDIRFAAPRKPWSFFHDSILRKSVNTSEQWSSTVVPIRWAVFSPRRLSQAQSSRRGALGLLPGFSLLARSGRSDGGQTSQFGTRMPSAAYYTQDVVR